MSNGWKVAIHERDGYHCKICGSQYHLTIQHKKAKCKGGQSNAENCVTWCSGCHKNYHQEWGLTTSDDYGNPLVREYGHRNNRKSNKPKYKHQHCKHSKKNRYQKHHRR